MADVTDRAQVLLLAALSMAILFVTLALILNTAIYTENLATRGSENAGASEAVRLLEAADEGIGGSIAYVNRHNDTGHDALQRNLSAATAAWSNASGPQFAHRGGSVDVSLDETTNGTRIAQDGPDRNFSDASGTADWTVVEDVDGTRNFRVNVSDISDLKDFNSDDEFEVNVSGSSGDYWRMNVTDDGGNVRVYVRNGTGEEFECNAVPVPVWLNVTAGTVDGNGCDALAFAEGVDRPYEISFTNADNVTGSYSLVVDNRTLATSPGPHLNDDGEDPYAAPAIYDADLNVTYRTSQLYYDASVRAEPGEHDE